jgi:iron complex transport system permease protein
LRKGNLPAGCISDGEGGGGAGVVSGFRIPLLGGFTLPGAGFLAGPAAVFFAIFFSAKIDKQFSGNTIILFGMVFSLFINAILTVVAALYREQLGNLLFWQMGSFSLKGWNSVALLIPFLLAGCAGLLRYHREMDILTFGDEQSKSLGADTEKLRMRLLALSEVLTGAAAALAGAIGFADLIAPHLARKIVGARHRLVLPMAALVGGSLLVVTDLAAWQTETGDEAAGREGHLADFPQRILRPH